MNWSEFLVWSMGEQRFGLRREGEYSLLDVLVKGVAKEQRLNCKVFEVVRIPHVGGTPQLMPRYSSIYCFLLSKRRLLVLGARRGQSVGGDVWELQFSHVLKMAEKLVASGLSGGVLRHRKILLRGDNSKENLLAAHHQHHWAEFDLVDPGSVNVVRRVVVDSVRFARGLDKWDWSSPVAVERSQLGVDWDDRRF